MMTEFGLMVKSIGPSMVTMGETVGATIKSRTLQGVDINGRPFASYSPKYAARKKSNHVNLFGNPRVSKRTKHMLESFRVSDGDEQRIVTATDGVGSKFRTFAPGSKGRFAKVDKDLRLNIVFADPESAKIGNILHSGGGKFPPRPWQGITPLESQEAFRVFNKNLYVMKDTTEEVRLGDNI